MSKFTTFQCSICSKSRDFLNDPLRILPNNCSLTTNCSGKLYPQGDKESSDNYYRQNITQSIDIAEVKGPSTFSFKNSKNPLINVAVQSSVNLPDVLNLNLSLKKIDNVRFNQYLFSVSQQTLTIPEIVNGSVKKDVNGKNLTFTTDDILLGKIYVSKNGVNSRIGAEISSITPGSITFSEPLLPGTKVTVIVYDGQKIVPGKLTLFKNTYKKMTYGAWSDIANIRSYEKTDGNLPTNWAVYNCEDFQRLSGNFKAMITTLTDEEGAVIKGINQMDGIMFLLSSHRYMTIDRYLNFVSPASNYTDDFKLNIFYTPRIEFTAAKEFLKEIYPPLMIESASIIDDLTGLINVKMIAGDDTNESFKSNKLLK
jgi:hypothetical protein